MSEINAAWREQRRWRRVKPIPNLHIGPKLPEAPIELPQQDFSAEIAALRRRLRCEIAALKAELKFRRLLRMSQKYNPSQPRDEIGRWSSGGGGNAGRARYAQNDTERKYTVNLNEEEARGGHTIREHVGKGDEELLTSVRRDRGRAGIYEYARRRNGSFDSVESANDFVNRTLERNQARVDLVASGKLDEAFVTARFGSVTGREAFRSDLRVDPYMRDTYGAGVDIRHDPRSARGYRVLTAYPRND